MSPGTMASNNLEITVPPFDASGIPFNPLYQIYKVVEPDAETFLAKKRVETIDKIGRAIWEGSTRTALFGMDTKKEEQVLHNSNLPHRGFGKALDI